MPRQLKTYVTTSGFFELAVAARTMKAALEIWGAGRDLFQRGYAKETSDPAIVNATMAKPGVVLRRGVGSRGSFKEKPDLPDVSAWEKPDNKPAAPKALAPKLPAPKSPAPERAASSPPKPPKPSAADLTAERKVARLYEAAQKKREREAARAEATERRARERRERVIENAEAALQEARATHDERVGAIEKERDNLERRAQEEDERWENEKRQLEARVRNARA